jgi:hypothetical protein
MSSVQTLIARSRDVRAYAGLRPVRPAMAQPDYIIRPSCTKCPDISRLNLLTNKLYNTHPRLRRFGRHIWIHEVSQTWRQAGFQASLANYTAYVRSAASVFLMTNQELETPVFHLVTTFIGPIACCVWSRSHLSPVFFCYSINKRRCSYPGINVINVS